jgi:hypothetical protein
MIALLRNWRLVLAAVLAIGITAPAAYWIGYGRGGDAREADLRAQAATDRLNTIADERMRSDEIETLPADDLRRRLNEWVRE